MSLTTATTVRHAGSFEPDARLYDAPACKVSTLLTLQASARQRADMLATMRAARRNHGVVADTSYDLVALRRRAAAEMRLYDAETYEDRVQAHYDLLRADQRDVVACMSYDGDNDGRGQSAVSVASTVVAISTGFNRKRIRDSHDARKSEDRSSERKPKEDQFLRDLTEQYRTPGEWIGADGTPVDSACYSIQPDGTRVLFAQPGDEREQADKPSKPRQMTRKQRAAAANRLAAGTIRMADQD